MILDANILLNAVNTTARHHGVAVAFMEEHLNGDVRVGLPWQSVGAFVRIATHPRIMANPMSPASAAAQVEAWFAAPATWLPAVTPHTWSLLRRLLEDHEVGGNLVPDAQLAALAIQYGVPVVSGDSDFARFPEIAWINPLVPS